jgi:hypothetical protein
MVHEFEEIICVKSWIQKNRNNKKLSKEMFIKGEKYFPSTEVISLMILEEFIVVSIILYIAIKTSILEIVVALFIAYTLHLIGHLFQALKFRVWTPGSRTTAITLLPIFFIFYLVFSTENLNITKTIILTIVFAIVFALNLQFLHRAGSRMTK